MGRRWPIVAGAFLAHVAAVGPIYAFGVLFPLITEEFGRGQGATAWIIGVTQLVMLLGARPAGRFVDRFGPTAVVRVGALVMVAGLLISSVAPTLPVVIVAFGGLVGIGMTVGFVPGVTAVSQWFRARRGLALGVAVSGSGVGAFIMSPLIDFLVRMGSWRTAMRWLSVIVFAALIVVSIALKPGPASASSPRNAPLKALLAGTAFRRIFIGHALVGFSFMVPFVYLVPYSLDSGLEASTAAWFLGLMGLAGVAGRVALGVVGDRFGASLAMVVTTIGMIGGHLVWLGPTSRASLLIVALFYGFFAGAYAALIPAVTAQYVGLEDFAAVVGGIYAASAVGMLIAAPIVGVIFDETGSYAAGIVISTVFLAAGLAVYVRLWTDTKARVPAA